MFSVHLFLKCLLKYCSQPANGETGLAVSHTSQISSLPLVSCSVLLLLLLDQDLSLDLLDLELFLLRDLVFLWLCFFFDVIPLPFDLLPLL